MGDAAAALSVRAVGRHFGDRRALDDVSFDLRPGELVALIGHNGAGKTTLLSIIAGALAPSSGDVERPAGRSTGWVPQQPALYSKLTVAENLRLFAQLEGVADVEQALGRMLAQTDLTERADEQVGRLSGGNQQRVNVAIALLSAPEVLLLDEPSSSLDPQQRARFWEFIGELADRGTSVLYSTHDLLEAQHHADRVLALEQGRLVYAGVPAGMDWSV